MPASPALVDVPGRLVRVERPEPPLRFSHITAELAASENAGNRFDVLGGGVLYASTDAQGAFAETTAQFRRSASIIARIARAGGSLEEQDGPSVDASWRASRILRTLSIRDALPFVDIEDPDTHTFLTQAAPTALTGAGVSVLDVATVRGPNRRLTRAIANWLYTRTDDAGTPLYGGIRYMSRLGDYECWAIFEGTLVVPVDERRITVDDPELVAVANRHGIRLT
ncbi:RES domain-containing protein [Leifsonia sp. PS1209]|uniref:RES domain-containing protein n=1 Tax=Leifsonia sp. PS1209 TaxID=2724914 RepID=UPI001442DDC7|nr:RES domain-containing protein [Leifsonia sp. PS1209]QJA00352.1 RES domain-containing protein [Leifsonia sp. PS1209]